jgi:hypothetical protein
VTGREIALVMPVSSTRGSFAITVDGVSHGTVSAYATSARSRQVLWRATFPTSVTRTIEIRNLGTAGHSRVDLDAVLVLR